MNTAYLRPGEFRICPRCSSRQKGVQKKCDQCGAPLDGASIASRAFIPSRAAARPASRGLRAVLVLAVVGAATIGVVLRNTFSSAAFDNAAAADNDKERVSARADVGGPDPSVYERAAVPPPTDPPAAWYGLGMRTALPPAAGTTIVEPGPTSVDPAAVGGMVGIAPGDTGLGRRLRSGATITNDDLASMRPAGVPPTPAPLDDRALVDRQRRLDAENELRAAQQKVEALKIEADTLRGQNVSDPELQQQQQRRLKQLLDDLEDAQKSVARAERKLREG